TGPDFICCRSGKARWRTNQLAVMSMTHGRAECTECGALIDTAADTPDSRVPCPNCGGTKPTVELSATGGRPSYYMLDNFVAHKLSLLTKCGARELPTNANWLNTFILN